MNFRPLKSADDLEQLVLRAGFIPYFAGVIPGFSVEEATDPDRLWNLEDGPWEWKGIVLRRMNVAYGHFARRKAAYVSLEILPDFLNFRRYCYSVFNKRTDTDRDSEVLETLRLHESLQSREIRNLCGFGRRRQSGLTPLEKLTGPKASRPSGFEPLMTRLQMGGWVTIADFEYDTDSKGNRRGWGIARYTTPEALYGNGIVAKADPWESFERIQKHLMTLGIDGADEKSTSRLINY